MKKLVITGLVFILLMPLLMVGCGGKEATTTNTTTSQHDNVIEITLDEFPTNEHQIKFLEMEQSSTLEVRLGSNPSTGYEWGDAVFDPPGVVKQISRNYEEPTTTGMVGAAGTEVWVFEGMSKGLTVLTIHYSRPFETEQEFLYSLTVNIRVK